MAGGGGGTWSWEPGPLVPAHASRAMCGYEPASQQKQRVGVKDSCGDGCVYVGQERWCSGDAGVAASAPSNDRNKPMKGSFSRKISSTLYQFDMS